MRNCVKAVLIMALAILLIFTMQSHFVGYLTRRGVSFGVTLCIFRQRDMIYLGDYLLRDS